MWISSFLVAAFAAAPSSQEPRSIAARSHTAPPTEVQASQWGDRRKIKVLYAGMPGGSRETVFREFLGVWFDEVGVIDLNELNARIADPFDVVVADWASHYGNDGYDADAPSRLRRTVTLGDEFDKPIVAFASVADHLRPEHKLDWL